MLCSEQKLEIKFPNFTDKFQRNSLISKGNTECPSRANNPGSCILYLFTKVPFQNFEYKAVQKNLNTLTLHKTDLYFSINHGWYSTIQFDNIH